MKLNDFSQVYVYVYVYVVSPQWTFSESFVFNLFRCCLLIICFRFSNLFHTVMEILIIIMVFKDVKLYIFLLKRFSWGGRGSSTNLGCDKGCVDGAQEVCPNVKHHLPDKPVLCGTR